MSSSVQLPVLECTIIVFRVLRNKQQEDEFSEAFLLRDDERESGLSVFWDCTHDEAREEFKKTYGVLSLHVGRIRTLSLDVIADEPKHANVTGVPHKEDNPKEAERLASLLAQQSRVCGALGLRKRKKVGL